MKRIFVDKEKLLEKKYVDILEKIAIKYYKGYEHEKIKEVSGKEVDELLADSEDYLKRLKELRKDIETKIQKKTFEEIYENVFKMMKALFGNKNESSLINDYEKEIVNKGKGNPKFIHVLKELNDTKKKYAAKKIPEKQEFENLRKDSVYLIESLVEYGQRKELGLLEKTKITITHKGKHSEIFLVKPIFLVSGDKIKKITDKIENSDVNELNTILSEYRGKPVSLDSNAMELLRKELGEFEIHF